MELALVDAETRPNDLLAALGERVAPVTLAADRTLCVAEPLEPLFAEAALVRGRVVSCRGPAATSMAFALVHRAMCEGAWLAVVDVATFGADAAAELGIPLERVVRVDAPDAEVWVDVMAAAADGFDLVIARVPDALCGERRPASVRRLATRLQQRGVVAIVVGDSGALGNDDTITTTESSWIGLGGGHGNLARRRIEVEAGGRRAPGRRTASLDIVGGMNRVELRVADRRPLAVDQRIAG